MNREEVFASLYSTETIYRPPLEESSALLEVASGCSYGQCYFCDFTRDPFCAFPLKVIEAKAKLMSTVIDGNSRLFLLGQNSFTFSAAYLTSIFQIIERYLPSVKEVCMYARVDDINCKTAAE